MTYRDENPPSFLAIGVLNCILCGGLGALLAFSAYGEAIGRSNRTWILGAGIAIFGAIGLPIIDWLSRKSRSIYRNGRNGLAAAIGVSYLMTNSAISPFLFMSMNSWVRAGGLLIGVGGNIWWIVKTIRINKIIHNDNSLLRKLYIDEGNFFVMTPKLDSQVIEKELKFNQMFPAYFLIPVVPLVPLSLVLQKAFEPYVGFSGFWTIAAFICIPLSMIFNGLLVKCGLMYFYYPAKLTKMTGKPIHFARFWDVK